MLLPMLAAMVMVFSEAPIVAQGPAPVAAPATTPAPVAATPSIDAVTAEINALLDPYKGKNGDRLRGRLGLSTGTRSAADGEIVFWILSVPPAMVCGVDPGNGLMRCDRGASAECRLAIAFDAKGMVKVWAVTGAPEVCRTFVVKLKAG